jgi:hypothetical protein
MKKIIKTAILFFLCFNMLQCFAFAYEDGNISYQTYDTQNEKDKVPGNPEIAWTGREYFRRVITDSDLENPAFTIQKSEDLKNWITLFEGKRPDYLISGKYGIALFASPLRETTWINGLYICRDGGFDYVNRHYKNLAEMTAGMNSVYIYNADYELIHTHRFDGYVRKVSYANGKMYAQIFGVSIVDAGSSMQSTAYNEKVYSSANGIDWELESDMKGVPVATGGRRLPVGMTTSWYDYYYKPPHIDLSLWLNADTNKSLVFEKHNKNELLKVGKYFCTFSDWVEDEANKSAVSFSKNGVYWVDVRLPDGQFFNYRITSSNEQNYSVYITEDSLVITNVYGNSAFVFSQAEIDSALDKIDDNAPYVMLNDKVLGFDTPPTIEAERTLIPLRFLFEQMGATVDWDNATQTATVSSETGNVSFSINNTTAKVNGQNETMDVPARLINGKTMVPLRFLSENLGYNVKWDENLNMAIITNN